MSERFGGEADYMKLAVEGEMAGLFDDTTIEDLEREVQERGGKLSSIVPPEMRNRINELKLKDSEGSLDEYELEEYAGLCQTAEKMLKTWLKDRASIDKAA